MICVFRRKSGLAPFVCTCRCADASMGTAGRHPARTPIRSSRGARWVLVRISAYAGYGGRHGTRVTRRPATGIDLGYEVADDAVEQAWRFEIDGVPAIRHHRESRRWDAALHQQRRRQAGPVLVASEDQRRHREAGHLVLQMIQRWTLLLAAELGVGGTQR